ncbi:MAG TPA: glycoside hydrolase family 27 protein, partial [Acidobacteriaceae bacterium]
RCMATAGLVSIMAAAQQPNVAPTPPMGWNSWDSYGLTITEPAFRANVKVLKQKLLPFGWNYAVIDEGWFFENPNDRDKPDTLRYAIDPYGRYVPVPARFPSSVSSTAPPPVHSGVTATVKLPATIEDTSFKVLGAWVHAQGLKFGIHIVRGIPRASVERNLPIQDSSFHAQDAADQTDVCPWDPTNWGVRNDAAGQAWYDAQMRQYAAWGVDLLKVDCISDHPYKLDEIQMIRRAIDKTGRPMVLSLSPGPTALAHAAEVSKLSNMWRISDDHWDVWDSNGKPFPQGTKDQFARLNAWNKYAKPGSWPDADMLPIGELGPQPGWGKARTSMLTPDEVKTELTLWSIARSPMILGANLTQLDAPTLALLTNSDWIAVSQKSTKSAQVLHDGNLIVWRATLPGDQIALALFNVGDTPLKIDRKFAKFSARLGTHAWSVRDVWAGKVLGKQTTISTELAPHACTLLLLQ